jgi:hypothetical protein
MIYPNGTTELKRLLDMVYSKYYDVWYDPYDGLKDSPNKIRITTKQDLLKAIENEYDKKGTICYDLTDDYINAHPLPGETSEDICSEVGNSHFKWEFAGKKNYMICNCSYLGREPEYVPLELVQFYDDFNSSCFQLCSWERDKEGYEFHSCGSRMFEEIPEEDLKTIWEGLQKADQYLNERWLHEERD